MHRPRALVFAAALALVTGAGLGAASALAADAPPEDQGPPPNPVEIAIPYHAEYEASMAPGWTIESCASLTPPADIVFTCEPDGMTFAADEYDPEFEKTPFAVALVNGAQRLLVTYLVSQAPPAIPVLAESLAYPYPFAAGAHALLPYSDLGITCEGCTGSGPIVKVLGTDPEAAGSARATPTHLEVSAAPGFVGTMSVRLTAKDPFDQVSVEGVVTVSFYADGDETLTGLHVVEPVDGTSASVDLTTLFTSSDDSDVEIIGCGAALVGTVLCDAAGQATYTAPADWLGVDQFSFHLLSENGEQSTGSVTLVNGDQLPIGLVSAAKIGKTGTIVPSTPVPADDASTAGLFAPLQGVLDRVTGRKNDITGEEIG